MIHLLFNTYEHTLEVNFSDTHESDTFDRVSTIKEHEKGYYEVLQKEEISGKNKPLFRFPINETVIQYVHNERADY